jgi:predicted nuclease of predicted toxin-antitoxin system
VIPKLLLDMNIPIRWVDVLAGEGVDAVHWSNVGNPQATDRKILGWALENGRVVFTHDLDFGAILAASGADGPSVFQVRTQNVLPESLKNLVLAALDAYSHELEQGALIVVDESTTRARVLPLR